MYVQLNMITGIPHHARNTGIVHCAWKRFSSPSFANSLWFWNLWE